MMLITVFQGKECFLYRNRVKKLDNITKNNYFITKTQTFGFDGIFIKYQIFSQTKKKMEMYALIMREYIQCSLNFSIFDKRFMI
jgi:hypothetical protein